jgi:hypothetical protein
MLAGAMATGMGKPQRNYGTNDKHWFHANIWVREKPVD